MKAAAMSLSFLGNEGRIIIPFFQRGYVWNTSNWSELLEELLDFEKSHFLGSLILKQHERRSGMPKEVVVIDGQQRLTTLSILLRALYDGFNTETQRHSAASLGYALFYKRNQTDKDAFVKIEHSRIDRIDFNKVIENKITEEEYAKIEVAASGSKSTSDQSKILQCYKFFFERLNQESEETRKTLFNRLLDQENKLLVVIDLSENENEQAIFDTINSAGVRLSSADIIKNALFQKAMEVFENPEEVERLYSEYWEASFLTDKETIAYWNLTRKTGRLTRDNLELLLHAIAVIIGFFDPDKHSLSDLGELYKKYVSKLAEEELTDFIANISEYAKLYRENILVYEDSTLFSFQNNYLRLFHILETCDISTFHPYILFLFKKYSGNTESLNSALHKLEKLVVRRMITRSETKSYNKFCKEFITQPSGPDVRIADLTDDEVINGLRYISNKNAALLLFWIELYRRDRDNRQSVKELKYNYSLEHIMPQKWEEYWSNVPVKDENGNRITDPETAKAERNAKIFYLGNMTLLNSRLNTSIRNYDFDRKINGENKKRGIRAYSDLGITRFDILAPHEAGDTVWDEQKIAARTASLAAEVLAIW